MNSTRHSTYTLAGGTLAFMVTVGISKVIETVQS